MRDHKSPRPAGGGGGDRGETMGLIGLLGACWRGGREETMGLTG